MDRHRYPGAEPDDAASRPGQAVVPSRIGVLSRIGVRSRIEAIGRVAPLAQFGWVPGAGLRARVLRDGGKD